MCWPLSSATAVCLARRGRAAARQSPLVALVLALLILTVPFLAYRGVASIAGSVGDALGDVAAARLALAGFGLSAAAGGAALVITLAHAPPVGGGVLAAPVRRSDRLASLLLLAVLTCAVTVVPVAAATICPLVGASPGGWGALPCVVVALAAMAAGGGAALVALRGAIGRRLGARRRLRSLAIGTGLLVLPTVALLCAAQALSGRGGAVGAITAGSGALVGSVLALERLLRGNAGTSSTAARSWRLPRGAVAATGVAGVALLVRRRDVATAIVGAVVIGGAGLALGMLSATPPPAGALVALGGGLIVLAPAGLAVGGIVLDGRAMWQLAPRARALSAAALAGGSLAVTVVVGTTIVLAGLALDEARPADLGPLAAIVAGGGLSALLAGTVVPWTKAGAGGQAATLGAFGMVAGIAAVCAGRIASALPPGGLVTWAVWTAIGCGFAVAGVAGLATLVGRAS